MVADRAGEPGAPVPRMPDPVKRDRDQTNGRAAPSRIPGDVELVEFILLDHRETDRTSLLKGDDERLESVKQPLSETLLGPQSTQFRRQKPIMPIGPTFHPDLRQHLDVLHSCGADSQRPIGRMMSFALRPRYRRST